MRPSTLPPMPGIMNKHGPGLPDFNGTMRAFPPVTADDGPYLTFEDDSRTQYTLHVQVCSTLYSQP
jgi:hypothetical protein